MDKTFKPTIYTLDGEIIDPLTGIKSALLVEINGKPIRGRVLRWYPTENTWYDEGKILRGIFKTKVYKHWRM